MNSLYYRNRPSFQQNYKPNSTSTTTESIRINMSHEPDNNIFKNNNDSTFQTTKAAAAGTAVGLTIASTVVTSA